MQKQQPNRPDRTLALVSVGFANFILWSSASFVYRLASNLPVPSPAGRPAAHASWILDWPMLIYAPSLLAIAMIPACYHKTGRRAIGFLLPMALLVQVLLLTLWLTGMGGALFPGRATPSGP